MRRRTFIQSAGIQVAGIPIAGFPIACGSAIAQPSAAVAQDFPTKPVTIVVPFSAGGPLDTLCRILAEPMQAALGQAVIVENVTGAGGAIGVDKVARSPADGYTLSAGNQGTHITLGVLQAVSFDLLRDFAPVIQIATNPQLILVRKDLPVANLRELLAWLRDNPNKATDGGAGFGTMAHVSLLYFQQLSGAKAQFVPYRGASLALQDLLSGQIDMMIDQPSNSLAYVLAGRVKALAVTAPQHLAAAPDIPTVDEEGLPKFYTSVWQALWAPRDTPPAIVARLNGAVRTALADPLVRHRFTELGQDIPRAAQQTPEALATFQKLEIARWVPLLKAAENAKAN